jgi:hypothetical protein
MADRVATELYYRFACSALAVTGTRETSFDWDTGKKRSVPTTDVNLFVEADPRRPIIRLPDLEGSHDLTLKLSGDGRLLSVSGTTRGLLGDIIEASVAVGSFAVGLIGAAIAPRLPGLPAVTGPPPPQDFAPTEEVEEEPAEVVERSPAAQWQDDDPGGDATRLAAAQTALADLHRALIEAASAMANAPKPASAFRRLLGIKSAIATLETEIGAIDIRRQAWYDERYRITEEHRFHLATDEAFVLKVAGAVPPRAVRKSSLEDESQVAREVLTHLDIAIVEVRSRGKSDVATIGDAADLDELERHDERSDLPAGVHFRVPRVAIIALYQDADGADKDDESRELTLHSVDRHWVVDLDSRMGSVPLRGEDDLTASATFAAEGFLESVSLDAEGKLEKIIEAFKGAPAQVAAGLQQAKSTAEAWDALRGARTERELKAVENRKKQLELEIARRGLAADAASHETLQQLKDRLERLKVERELAPAPQSAQDQADEAEKELAARLRTRIAIARAEAQLASYRDDDAAGGNGGG